MFPPSITTSGGSADEQGAASVGSRQSPRSDAVLSHAPVFRDDA